MVWNNKRMVPENELHFAFARSSGAGGQNVNKTSTKVMVSWSVDRSRVFTLEEKDRLKIKLSSRLTSRGELAIACETERTQWRNRSLAITRLNDLVTRALRVPKKRHPTRPNYASKLKRLESKKKHSKVKKLRRIEGD